MSKIAVMPLTDYKNACDTIREKTGGADVIKSGELTQRINEVYEKGIDAGKNAEYDAFWDTFQNNGEEMDYSYAFYGSHFNDETYNPKYDIKGSVLANTYRYTYISDTKKPIIAKSGINLSSMFYSSSNIKTIRKLIVDETNKFSTTFNGCNKLTNITFEGVIGNNISFASCPLTVESAKSILMLLKDYSGTANEYACTVTLNASVWEKLNTDTTAPNGITWEEYVYKKCWIY